MSAARTLSIAAAGILASVPARAAVPEDARFGLGARAYAVAGSEGFLSDAEPEESPPIWNLAAVGSFEAVAYRLIARLGAVLSAEGYPLRTARAAASQSPRPYRLGLADCSLRLRFGGAGADDGLLLGVARLQSNPDAILFGEYLARFQPYPARENRRPPAWDSLGTMAPRALGLRLAIGRRDGPARAEGWVVDETDIGPYARQYSLYAFLSGRAPRGIDWGLGWSAYRAFELGGRHTVPPTRDANPFDSTFIEDPSQAGVDTVHYTMSSPSRFSARMSLDPAALFGLEGMDGGFGGLFGEAAIQGWENQPYFYEDRWRRFAWTLGARLPTRGWPDVCVVQWEWRHETEPYPIVSGSWNAAVPVPMPRGEPVPGYFSPQAPPRRAYPGRVGLYLAERIGRAFEAQGRLLAYETAAGADGRRPAGKRVRALGRIVYRIP